VIAFALLLAYRPRILGRGPTPTLDLLVLIALVAAAVQTVPLPRPLIDVVSPAAVRAASQLALQDAGGALPLTIDLAESAAAVALFVGSIVIFFTARELFDAGGVRTVARGVAVIGLILASIGIAQDATADGLMYWRWRPTFDRTDPFGPFVNRNHYATWAIVAVPLSVGYLMAHASAHRDDSPAVSSRRRLMAAMDARAVLLLVAAALMILGVVVSLSRSGMLGLGAALATGGWLAYRRRKEDAGGRWRPALLVGALALAAVVLIVLRVPPDQVLGRVSDVPIALEDRVTIWRETLPIVRDFWVAGTGTGTYQTSMAIYQRSGAGLIFNQAHNHYLQIASEGGLLLSIPVALVLLRLARDGAAALWRDRSGLFWLRAGAASGLVGVAAQSVFETGLLTPANGVLTSIAAAILLHVPGRYGPPRLR
jgi:O-antigen ligase